MSSSISKYQIFLYILLLHCFVLFFQGCHTSNAKHEEKNPKRETQSKPAPNRLMQAILDEFKAQGRKIYLRDDENLWVITEYEAMGSEIRQRYTAKVIASPRGLAFKITSLYERRDRRTQPPRWVEQSGEAIFKQSYRDEQKLGKAIRARFK